MSNTTSDQEKLVYDTLANVYGNKETSNETTSASDGSSTTKVSAGYYTSPGYTSGQQVKTVNSNTTGNKLGLSNTSYDSSSDAAYQAALAKLEEVNGATPTYTNSYADKLDALYEQIVNRDKFTYDLNADALYKQYAQQYAMNGQMAMMDTMGQAATLNGGYGSSYAQQVGQQTYDEYLRGINDVLPTLYNQAYQQYQDQGDAMLQQYSMLGDRADDEYAKYLDQYNQWSADRGYYTDIADSAYNRGFNEWSTAYQNEQTQLAQNREYIISLISATGYNPSDLELAQSGMTREQANALIKAYKKANKSSGGGGYKKQDDGDGDGDGPEVISEAEYVANVGDPEYRKDAQKKFESGEWVIAPRTEVR